MYRSFVTCDDPKGVVECGTIRRSKSGSKRMEHKKQKNSNNSSLAVKAKKDQEMVSKEEYSNSSSYQLEEVSRGAQKLNRMINSWSKGLSYDGYSKDIAKDLLKGALDLQESLIMLGKAQEASQYMSQLKEKDKEAVERGRLDEVVDERKNLNQFGDQNYQMGFSKQRLSADGSSGDCVEELKKGITESLAKHNVMTNTKEKSCFERKRIDPASDLPSTSSSQSSMVQSRNSQSTASSISETVSNKKEKSPNLITKLMGLEDIPSKPLQRTSEKHFDTEKKILSQQRPDFDIEKLRVRKPQSVVHEVDSEQEKMKEIIETIQFRGLLKSGPVNELKSCSHQSSGSHTRHRSIDNMPPIVLIKPCVPCMQSKQAVAPRFRKEEALHRKMMQLKKKAKEGLVLGSIDYKEGTLNTSKMLWKTDAEETPIKRLSQEEGAKDHREVAAKPEEKEIKMVVQKEGAVNANKTCRKPEAEEALMKRLGQKRGAKDHKEKVGKVEEKKGKTELKIEEENVKTELKGSAMMKASSPVTNQQQRKETTDKKVDKIQKVAAASRKQLEREIVKTKIVSKSQDQAKMISAKLRKPETGSNITKTQVPQQCSTASKTKLKPTAETMVQNIKDQKRKHKPVDEPTTSKLATENLECKEDAKSIDLICNNDSDLNGSATTIADQSKEKGGNASTFQAEEQCSDSQSSVSSITLLSSENEKKPKSSEEADDHIGHIRSCSTSLKSGNHLKALLLSSPSFLTYAEELFQLNIGCPKILPESGICDSIFNIKLSLDYANEVLERKSLPDSRTRHPLLPPCYVGNSRISLSLDQLVEEVSDGVETLRSYHGLACGKHLQTDNILDRDMRRKGLVSGTWDLGWKNGCLTVEAEQIVNDIEKLLVSQLIEEVFT